ncbi:FAD-binding oxidoreductase [candidate division KSB1 bacterium]|nr:FAD-binding oxidoreductase [candidate division KSB1 bacterium]
MPGLTSQDTVWLSDKMGKRVTFNKTERMLYGHDIAAMPRLFKPLIGDTIPDAVVQPTNEQELVDIVQWAASRKIPLTPRGKASSGYGGVLPTRNGIVVDFYHMKDVIDIDPNGLNVTVQPGITWEQLDKKLAPNNLMLRLYPSSYPSSSAGGWLAQGGAGFGSYEFGWFSENVESARVVLPSGEVRVFSGNELELIADAEGITGIISEVKVKVQPLQKLDVIAIAFADADKFTSAMKEITASKMPIWSIVFINPRMAEMKNRAPAMTHFGHPVGHKPMLPAAYVATIAFRENDIDAIMKQLPDIVKNHQGDVLSENIARHEWEERFKLMVVKRLGPSLVPAEVVVPLKNFDRVMDDIEKKVDQPVVKEGVIIKNSKSGEPEVVILGFIPSDQRKFAYNLVFGLVLTILKIASKHGGRAYSTGLYFSSKAREILGEPRLERLKKFKHEVDPKSVLNPDKVIGSKLISRIMGISNVLEPIARPFGNLVIQKVDERPDPKPIKDIPGDVAWYAYACSQCGYCVDECDQFYGRGWESQSPRGKWYWLREYLEGRVQWDQKMVDTFILCTTCELCNHRCSASLPIEPSWMKLRGKLIDEKKEMTFPPFEMMAAALRAEGNIWAGYRKDRTDWFPKELLKKHGPETRSKAVYFAGCTSSYVEHDIAQASVTLLDAAGVDFTYAGKAENCCGTPMLAAGKWDVFAEVMRKNVEVVKAIGADTVITSCPACDMMWRHVYKEWAKKLGMEYNITSKHYSEVISEKLHSGEFKYTHEVNQRVTWHDSCHMGRVSGVYEPPRDMIKAIPGIDFVEMENNRDKAHCCGSVLTLIKDPLVAHDIGKVRLDEAVDNKSDAVLALCPCCEFQLRVSKDKKTVPVEVHDLAAFACRGLGKTFADPNPEVAKQWKVFEGMIALMTPSGFADLMDSMWPELLEAMPLGMGGLMKGMGKMGKVGDAMFAMMKPMFPVLFPKLLPGMMPKVMPTMLERVGGQIPMPDYMAEQMPEMMPQVMDNLMPKMLPDVVPLVVPKMIDYLRGRNGHSAKVGA